MTEEKVISAVELAADLLPIVRTLYDVGVISIHGTDNGIQMTAEAFHTAFHSWFVKDRSDEYVEHHIKTNGADFFALVRRDMAGAWG